jgi:peptidoglycan/LPS O-acetylase OafA/YrhL
MNRLALVAWPAYAEAFPSHSFTTGMLFARLATAIVALFCSGYLAARIARGERTAVLIAAGVLLLLGGANHLTEPTWSHFPLWYHLAFIGFIAPCVMVGGHFQPPEAD